jgi:hypothetical protein
MMMHEDQTHIKRKYLSIGIISSNLQSGCYKKAGCSHVKTLAQAKATFFVDDTKDPSAEASLIGKKNFTDI